MTKRRAALDDELEAMRTDPDRYPYACLPATHEPACAACPFCDFVVVATTAAEAARAMTAHATYEVGQ